MKKTKWLIAVALMAAVGSQAGIIAGQKLKLDFTDGWHPGAYGDVPSKAGNNGEIWNYYNAFNTGQNATTGNFTDMVDAAGNLVSGVSLTAGGWGGGNWNGGTAWPNEWVGNVDDVLWDQYVNFWWASDSSTEDITIHGLDSGLTYDVRLYALNPRDPGTGTTTEITLNGSTINGGHQGDRWHSATATTIFDWSGISAPAGDLQFSWNAYDPDNPVLNAIVIDAIPEPATLGLVAMVGCGIVFIRKRLMI